MNDKHTPGPWVYGITGDVYCPDCAPEDLEEPEPFTAGLAKGFLRVAKKRPMCLGCGKEFPCAS